MLSVVIVSWNVRDLLARCLHTLVSDLGTSSIDSRIVVVDNASHDGSVGMLRARFPQVDVKALAENLGFAAGNNVGLRSLETSEVLLLNPDTEIRPGAIRTLLDAYHSLPDAAVVTSCLVYGDGSFQHSAFRFPGLAQLYIDLFPVHPRLYESRLNGRYARRLYQAGRPFEIDHPLGAVMLLRADAIRHVGFLDEGFALYCEEIDWCARFRAAGWRNYCVPTATVVHHGGQSTTQEQGVSFVKLWTARHRLHVKHPDFAPMPLARLIVRAGMRRRMRGASDDTRAACQRIIDVWGQERHKDEARRTG